MLWRIRRPKAKIARRRRRRGMEATPDHQRGKVHAVVGMKMAKCDMRIAGVLDFLQARQSSRTHIHHD
ncbi:hypothetical protein AWU68_1951 [Corynebacterium simulans]|nr:hypothetical protein AWU68_1951 [Corynebacterium simulans]